METHSQDEFLKRFIKNKALARGTQESVDSLLRHDKEKAQRILSYPFYYLMDDTTAWYDKVPTPVWALVGLNAILPCCIAMLAGKGIDAARNKINAGRIEAFAKKM